jgi:hypothetical protein
VYAYMHVETGLLYSSNTNLNGKGMKRSWPIWLFAIRMGK